MKKVIGTIAYVAAVVAFVWGVNKAIYAFAPECPDGTFVFLANYEFKCVPEIGRNP